MERNICNHDYNKRRSKANLVKLIPLFCGAQAMLCFRLCKDEGNSNKTKTEQSIMVKEEILSKTKYKKFNLSE